jgi:hypothetical protein
MKSKIKYLLGGLISFFVAGRINAAKEALYGPGPGEFNKFSMPVYGPMVSSQADTFGEKLVEFIKTPVTIIIFAVVAVVIGIFIFLKNRKNEN